MGEVSNGMFAKKRNGKVVLSSRRFDREGVPIDERESTGLTREKALSGSFTAISAFGDIASGFQEAANLKAEGRQLDFEARNESLRGASAAINESLRGTQSIVSQVLPDAASLTGSSANSIVSEFDDVNRNINIIRFGAEERSLLLRAAARKRRKQSKFAKVGGFFKAANRVGSMFSGGFGG